MSTPATALAEANDRRHQAALSAAHKAIARLQREGHVVTFRSVATEADVSRAWLYREPTIRELILRCRTATDRPIPLRSPHRASPDSVRQITDALRAELIRLKHENQDLRDQLARKLGDQRARTTSRQTGHGEDMSTPSTPNLTRGSSH